MPFKRIGCDLIASENITWTITSGSLTNLNISDSIGSFNEALFIDLVDTEYCLRAIDNGYKIKVCCESNLSHRVGKREERNLFGFKFYPTHHSTERRYFSFRNRVLVMKKYGLKFPHWTLYETIAAFYVLFCIISFEENKFGKLSACMKGIFDGLFNRFGSARYLIK